MSKLLSLHWITAELIGLRRGYQWGRYGLDHDGHCTRVAYDPSRVVVVLRGLVRSKNVLSVLLQCFTIACVMSISWLVIGYSLAFGDGGSLNAFIGG